MKPAVVLVIVLVIIHLTVGDQGAVEVEEVDHQQVWPTGGTEYRPVIEFEDIQNNITNTRRRRRRRSRRRLAPYQLCLLCKCCTAAATNSSSTCLTMPCCFGIDCNLPNKPFGVCAFVPKTCNCTSCTS
ncbi:hypothetical protein Ddye_008644 [Dipteronia dyeriana]|uniref:DUF7866 domain-containing protein n=1 Tax=Dipteronia dyeriana TaxID=168575 RepID=A0AAD9XA86_9ROSI|nr:hypothetical protein Ddye_008644 [Dipteronia dyeriana]